MADVGSIVVTVTVEHVFASEDTLGTFVHSLDKKQAAALFELLHNGGCRWSGRALSDWRASK